MSTPAPTASTPRLPTWAARGLFAIALVFLLREAEAVLMPVLVAVVLTFMLATPVRWLRARGIPESIGAGLVVLALIGGAAALGSMLAGPAAQWWERAPSTVAQLMAQLDRLRAALPLTPPPQVRIQVPYQPPPARASARKPAASQAQAQPDPPAAPPVDPVKERITSEGIELTRAVLSRALQFGLSAAATVILLYFLLASEHWMVSRTVEAIPRRRTRAIVLLAVRQAQREIGQFLGTLSIINLGVAIAMALAMTWLDVQNPLLWGTVAGLLNFIPYLGPLMIVGLLLLAGLATYGATSLILAPPAAFLLIHAVESNIISPWFVGRQLTLSPLAVFLSVMFWGWLWGIAGAMIAVPLLIALRCATGRHPRMRLLAHYLEGDQRPVPSLPILLRAPRQARRLRKAQRDAADATEAASQTPDA